MLSLHPDIVRRLAETAMEMSSDAIVIVPDVTPCLVHPFDTSSQSTGDQVSLHVFGP